MKKFRVSFEMDRCYGSLLLSANSEREAKKTFELLSPDDVMELASIVPEFEIEYIEEEQQGR